jgi:TRAP transporter TAXI family solute receptor
MSNPSSNPFDLAAYLPKREREHAATEWHSVENDCEGHLRSWLKRARQAAQLLAVKGAACLAVGSLANVLVTMTLETELVAPAHAQTVPKSLEQGGTDAALKQRRNTWTVGIAGGQRSGTYMTFADELAQVLDDGDNLRVLPIVTYGAASNLDDLLYLRHVDLVITQSDIFEYFRTQRKTPNLESKIHYIISLTLSEMHVLARTDIQTIEDLRGKKVSFGPAGSASSLTGTIVFQRLGVNVEQVLLDNPTALQMLKSGELAALVRVIGKPVDFFAQIPANSGLHLVPISFSEIFADQYTLGEFTSQEYPTLVPQGEKIDTIAVPAVLAVYNWPKESDRYRRVQRFTEALFTKWDKFREPHRHPKWRDVNFAATVPGWTRWSVAEKMLGRMQQKDQQVAEFESFLNFQSRALTTLTQEQREALFDHFLKWQEQRSSVQQQRSSVQQQRSSVQQQRSSVKQQPSSVKQQRSSVKQQPSSVKQQQSSAKQQQSSAKQQRTSVQR